MPSSTRWRIKQELDQAQSLGEKACYYVGRVAEEYRPFHPDIAESMDGLVQVMLQAWQMLHDIRDKL